MTTVDDMRLLDQIAEEIRDHGASYLPDTMRRCIRGAQAKRVAETLEKTAAQLMWLKSSSEYEQRKMQREIDGLREDIQRMTDIQLESKS